MMALTNYDMVGEFREAMSEGNTIVMTDTHEYRTSIALGHKAKNKLLALR